MANDDIVLNQTSDITQEIYRIGMLKAALVVLGPVGGIFTAIIDAYQDFQNKRLLEFLQSIHTFFISHLPAHMEGTNVGSMDQEVLTELVTEVINASMKSSSEVRRSRLRNILFNSIINQVAELEDSRKFIKITDDISETQVMILYQFNQNGPRRQLLQAQLDDLTRMQTNEANKLSQEAKQHKQKVDLGSIPSIIEIKSVREKVSEQLRAIPDPSRSESHDGIDKITFDSALQWLHTNGLLYDRWVMNRNMPRGMYFDISDLGKKYLVYLSETVPTS